VYYAGFNSDKSFGGNSYVIRHPDGNWLIDSPRYIKHLVDAFERMGGIAYIFLTHEDDVADAARYAARFGAKRLIHRADAGAQPDAEWIIDGTEPQEVQPGFTIIPVPGHTEGSMALLHARRYLFSGDHLWWDRDLGGLDVPRVYVWSNAKLRRSTEKLLAYDFDWVLPGHGERMHRPAAAMRESLRAVIERRWSAAAKTG
jgi:glyoxylase-like metal-dependent hydrolase (beta-lactamase superfamily II)